ncbi:TDP-N-acetylfucosamine:lipid II N-acetylfucosaminyltransferase family protein [Algoriphagus taiwanensis]|uniref:TDP-N-acetylfucosamine:lipid II N-acetylfucosaminyltransferase n=1 Tax=Algoriphagus taiwanensis TaxID=1445656 RepID=UPI0030C76A4A
MKVIEKKLNIKKRILHIVSDEKFIDSASRDFNGANPNGNTYLLPEKSKKLQFIKKTNVYFVNSKIFPYILPLFSFFFKCIIFHSLYKDSHKKAIKFIPPWVNVCWISWGFDLYPLFFNSDQILRKKTLELIKNTSDLSKNFKSKNLNHFSIKAIQRIDFFSTVLPLEFDFIKSEFNINDTKYISWNYLNLEDDIIRGFENKTVSGNNILISHSASVENNHLDSFDDIINSNLNFEKIICPLSYGNSKYGDYVEKKGFDIFGNKFYPIREFLPYEEYVNLLISCNISVFGSVRQIGLGNILLMLYLGSSVVLDKSSITYDFFSNRGIKIFNQLNFNLSINNDELIFTRRSLEEIWSKENKRKRTMQFVKKVIV